MFLTKKFSLMNYILCTSKGGGEIRPIFAYDDWGSGGGAGGIGSGSEHEL